MGSSSEWVLEAPPAPGGTRLPYGTETVQFAELRVPDGAGPHPLAIAIHGGFWKAAYGLEHLSHACEALRQEGIATLSLEYRRVGHPGGGYPGTLEDVVEALRLLPDVGARGVEVERTVVFGHSAGGHLALWLAGEARRRMGSSSAIVGAVSLAGVTDLARAAALRLGSSAAQAFMGGEPDERPEAYALASPIARVPIHLSQTLIHGEADDTVPVALSEAYAEAARVAGDEVELEILPGAGHFELVDPRAAQWPRVVTAIRTSLDLWERSPDRDATS